jgi:hypothetical protein
MAGAEKKKEKSVILITKICHCSIEVLAAITLNVYRTKQVLYAVN